MSCKNSWSGDGQHDGTEVCATCGEPLTARAKELAAGKARIQAAKAEAAKKNAAADAQKHKNRSDGAKRGWGTRKRNGK